MVDGACRIKQYHTGDKDGKSQYMAGAGFLRSLDEERGSGTQSQDHGNKMSQGTAWIFDFQSHKDSSLKKQCSFENYV